MAQEKFDVVKYIQESPTSELIGWRALMREFATRKREKGDPYSEENRAADLENVSRITDELEKRAHPKNDWK